MSLSDLKADFARDHVRDANPSPRVAALAMSSPREANLVEEEAALPALKMSKTLGAADVPRARPVALPGAGAGIRDVCGEAHGARDHARHVGDPVRVHGVG